MTHYLEPLKTPYSHVGRTLLALLLVLIGSFIAFSPLALSLLQVSSRILQVLIIVASIIVYILFFGYLSTQLRHVAKNKLYSMAPYENIIDLLIDGIKLGGALLIYYIPLQLLLFIPNNVGFILVIVYSIVVLIIIPAALINSSITNRFIGAFEYSPMFRALNIKDYALAYLFSIVSLAVYAIVTFLMGWVLFTIIPNGFVAYAIFYVFLLFFILAGIFTTLAFFAKACLFNSRPARIKRKAGF